MVERAQQFGKYEILGELGKGGFATVYRARDTTLDREVALKILHPQLLSDSLFIQRFRQEARTLAALRHPQIITIYEVGESVGRLFIAMELAHGPSLDQSIAKRGHISWEEALALLKPICEALDYAHSQNVIHRDLKPSNILLDAQRGPLLTDFGFAHLMGKSSVSLSVSGGVVGTPGYIAPEVWDLDATAAPVDTYALGCIIYEMLTGEVLFRGQTPMQAMRAHDRGPQFPAAWPAGLPAGIEVVLSKALARDPAARYTDAMALWHALNDLAPQAKVAAQWRAETEAALVKGEQSAARMAIARWLAVAPDDPAAKVAQAEIERRSVAATPAANGAAKPKAAAAPADQMLAEMLQVAAQPPAAETSQKPAPWPQQPPAALPLLRQMPSWALALGAVLIVLALVAIGWRLVGDGGGGGGTPPSPSPANTSAPGGGVSKTPTPPTEPATSTPTPENAPTWTTAPTISPTPEPGCRVLVDQLNLREGPGTAYNVHSVLPAGTYLRPLMRSPDEPSIAGLWIEVEAKVYGTGWVSADPGRLECNVDVARLPIEVDVPPLPFRVKVVTNVSPASSETCPATFSFSAVINATGAGTITYRWERSDGVRSPEQTLTFDRLGSRTVNNVWEINNPYSGWERVRILAPGEQVSNEASFTLPSCQPTVPGRIAFVSNRDGNDEIYVLNAHSSTPIRLTDNPSGDVLPSWSPDGQRIAFVTFRDGDPEIYAMNADGSNLTKLTFNEGWETTPVWSPDGKSIMFMSNRDGDSDIYVMNADGSEQRAVVNTSANEYSPQWSPDGRYISYISDRDGNKEIYVMGADGSNPRRLTSTGATEWSPVWSPDGTRIAFISERDGDDDIYVMNADGSGQTPLTDNSARESDPAWSYDGRRIAFVSWRDGNAEIYVMNADGSEAMNLTNNSAEDKQPSWHQ